MAGAQEELGARAPVDRAPQMGAVESEGCEVALASAPRDDGLRAVRKTRGEGVDERVHRFGEPDGGNGIGGGVVTYAIIKLARAGKRVGILDLRTGRG